MHSARKRFKALFMSVAFYKWTSLFFAPFEPGETRSGLQDAKCRGVQASARADSNAQFWCATKPSRIARLLLPGGRSNSRAENKPRQKLSVSRDGKSTFAMYLQASCIRTLQRSPLLRGCAVPTLMLTATVDFSPPCVLAAMKSLPSHKVCGPDLLPAELLKASGLVGSSAIADVSGRTHLEENGCCSGKKVGKSTSLRAKAMLKSVMRRVVCCRYQQRF